MTLRSIPTSLPFSHSLIVGKLKNPSDWIYSGPRSFNTSLTAADSHISRLQCPPPPPWFWRIQDHSYPFKTIAKFGLPKVGFTSSQMHFQEVVFPSPPFNPGGLSQAGNIPPREIEQSFLSRPSEFYSLFPCNDVNTPLDVIPQSPPKWDIRPILRLKCSNFVLRGHFPFDSGGQGQWSPHQFPRYLRPA